ncbi:hypothetical protein ACHAXA_002806 [Cyclostephanos tholiformis]|uniref:Uncharacterized protein n=1 Tax=Cyclostephanos tholiformis TaxID=382380 RepID=A0ABD3R170_9STRA
MSGVVQRATIQLVARTGIIKTSAFDACTRTIEYEVEGNERSASTVGGEIDFPVAENCNVARKTTTIAEGKIAYAVRCPVLVRMKNSNDYDSSNNGTSEMGGRIINVTPAIRGQRGGGWKFLYSKLLSTDDGDGVLMEEDVPPERILYRYSLGAPQNSIGK